MLFDIRISDDINPASGIFDLLLATSSILDNKLYVKRRIDHVILPRKQVLPEVVTENIK